MTSDFDKDLQKYGETSLSDNLDWLFARQRFGIKPGLSRVRELLNRLGQPHESFRVILVGGTNGKGSTASTLASILNSAGIKAGLFTSPHLTHFAERFVVNGESLSDEAIFVSLEHIRPLAEELEATFFEIVTALGCMLFARASVEIAIFELGLGGRFDATNVLTPELSIITGVALDHREVLGETVAEIASDKAGIMRPDKLCLTGADDRALSVLQAEAQRLGARLWALAQDINYSVGNLGWQGFDCALDSPLGHLELQSPLIGEHQARNVILAAVAAQVLGVEQMAIQEGVERTRWPGRLEPIRYQNRIFLLDGAHNPEAATVLAQAVRALGFKRVRLIFGASQDKDIASITDALSEIASEVIVTKSKSPRAAAPQALVNFWSVPVKLADHVEAALGLALAASKPDELILAAGSLYLVGELRAILLRQVSEPWLCYQ